MQVSLYFPESSHQAFGIIRAVLRDSTDMDIGDVSQVSDPSTQSNMHFRSSPGTVVSGSSTRRAFLSSL